MFEGRSQSSTTNQDSNVVSHNLWNSLVKEHVDSEGWVDYEGFKNDRDQLKIYLDNLQSHPPDKDNWTEYERLAYWINAYNAFTVELILDHYPVESIKDIGSIIQIPFINTHWDIKFIKIRDKKLDLNNIEHSILRKRFNEPRIHFAINCASVSCPRLRNEAYIAEKLDRQLDDQAVGFLNNPHENRINPDEVHISKIFSWFTGDFTKNGSLIEFLNQYTAVEIKPNAEINYMDYDWGLNEQD